jgi:hypothetical protein
MNDIDIEKYFFIFEKAYILVERAEDAAADAVERVEEARRAAGEAKDALYELYSDCKSRLRKDTEKGG